MTTIVVDSGGLGFRIERVWAFVVVADDGDEALPAFPGPDGPMPMLAADEARLRDLRPLAALMSQAFGKTIRLVRFDCPVEVERFEP